MTQEQALKIARTTLAPYRRGNHVSAGAGEIATAVAAALVEAWRDGQLKPSK